MAVETDVTTGDVPKLITWAPLGKTNTSVTPFGGKVEVALIMAGIDYTVEAGDPTNNKTFVKQKACPRLPVLQHFIDLLVP